MDVLAIYLNIFLDFHLILTVSMTKITSHLCLITFVDSITLSLYSLSYLRLPRADASKYVNRMG